MIYSKNKSQGSEFEACWLEIVGSANNSIRCNIQTPKTKTDANPKIILKYLKNRLNKICCNVCFAISAENRYGRDAGGGGGGGGGVFSLHTRFCVIVDFPFCMFHKLIRNLLPIEPQKHKLSTLKYKGQFA